MKEKLEKMLNYICLAEESKRKEDNIVTSRHFSIFDKEIEGKEELSFQRKVTQRLLNRVQTLKREL